MFFDDWLERLCQKVNTHLYTVSSIDKIAAVIVISLCFWRDATLIQRDKCPLSSDGSVLYCIGYKYGAVTWWRNDSNEVR